MIRDAVIAILMLVLAYTAIELASARRELQKMTVKFEQMEATK